MEGYQTRSSYENAGGAGTSVINANLVQNAPSFGWFDTNPFGADIYIDNNYYGNGAQTIALSPGSHSLAIKKPGYNDYQGQITITAG